MVKQTIITIVCDLPHPKGDDPGDAKPFEVSDGKNRFEIDVCEKHAKPLVQAMANGRKLARR
jgi:hypothetical protein